MRTILLCHDACHRTWLGSLGLLSDNNVSQANQTGKMRQELTQMLQKSEYTDIRAAPTFVRTILN